MADITLKAWINEIKPSQYGQIWKVAESHSKKNPQTGAYEPDGKSFYDVYVNSDVAANSKVGDRVEIVGRFRTKKNETAEGKVYENLIVYANEVTAVTSATAPAAPVADAPF